MYVKSSVENEGKGTNQRMTGYYIDYRKGGHKAGASKAHDAFRQIEGHPFHRTGATNRTLELERCSCLQHVAESFPYRLMSGVLFDLGTADPMTYVSLAAPMGIAALLISYLPARRATRVDPLVPLHSD
jgi:hypothetical protein